MCGRYQNRAEKQRIAEAFRVGIPPTFEIPQSYNIAPQTTQPIVRLSRDTPEREIALLRWGLVPFFAKDAKVGYSTVNARAETVTTSPVFREAMKRRRCLVPATGFYEWQKLDKKTTIITTDPNDLVQPLHDRMPVILAPQDYARWLDSGDPERLPIDLMRPFPADAMTAWKVSSAVGNTKNDRPELRLPMDAGPPDLFSGMNPEEAFPID